MKQQNQWVRSRLLKRGSVTRNEAIRNGITRLSARIWDLRDQGMNIEGVRMPLKNGSYDWIYKLKIEEDEQNT